MCSARLVALVVRYSGNMSDLRDVIIVGSGPAGYTAAIYLGRAGFKPLVIAGALTPGGQLVNTTEVENFPGFPDGVMGPELMDNMQRQAEKFGAEIVWDDVVSVSNNDVTGVKTVSVDQGDVFETHALIIATGSPERRNIPARECHIARPATASSSEISRLLWSAAAIAHSPRLIFFHDLDRR